MEGFNYYLQAMIEKKDLLYKYVGGDIGSDHLAPLFSTPKIPSQRAPASYAHKHMKT